MFRFPRPAFLLFAFAALCGTVLSPTPGRAQATRTWVSGVGDDANPCSRTAPCKTFAGAISKTAAGGEINCLDPGGFGALTITKSITIDCAGTFGSVLSSLVTGITISPSLPANGVVILRNLSINGAGNGISGIRYLAGAGTLRVDNVQIFGFTQRGIEFAPTGAAELYVRESSTTECAINGIQIRPTGTATARAVLNRVSMDNNGGNGLSVDGSATTGGAPGVNVLVRDSVAAGNSSVGISVNAVPGSAITRVMIDRTAAVNNTTGVLAQGVSTTLIGNSSVMGNTTGLSFVVGATLNSYGTSQNNANITDNGAPSGTIPMQ